MCSTAGSSSWPTITWSNRPLVHRRQAGRKVRSRTRFRRSGAASSSPGCALPASSNSTGAVDRMSALGRVARASRTKGADRPEALNLERPALQPILAPFDGIDETAQAVTGICLISFGRDRTIYNPWHHLPVLANKLGALRNGAPLQGWDLPPALARLRRWRRGRPALRARAGGRADRMPSCPVDAISCSSAV